MVNIIAQGFGNVNKIGLDCQSSHLSTHFFASFSSYHCPIHANKTAQKIALLKKQGVAGAGQRSRTSISFQEEKYSGN